MKGYHVVNLHFIDKCNYECKYCFAPMYKEVRPLAIEKWYQIIDQIAQYFRSNNIDEGRINLVGGEPLLYKRLFELIDYIHSNQIRISLITNGSLLTKSKINQMKGKVESIGISVDSLNEASNLKIGRHQLGKTLDINKLTDLCLYIKDQGIHLKINTVVSTINEDEDFNHFYELVKPDRLKLFQVHINRGINDHYQHLVPSLEKFNAFVKRHRHHSPVVETSEQMEAAYLMIDSQGKLLSNKGGQYTTIGYVYEEDFLTLVQMAEMNVNNYYQRYKDNWL